MDPTQSSILIFLAVVTYIIIVDKNVEDFIVLLFKISKVNIERLMWMIRFHPRNPITNYIQQKKYEKLAEELHKEMMSKND